MKDKNTAGIFALLLGGIGVHKFYLDQPILGLLYLLFCWTFVPAIISLIEGIVYLTMNQVAFDAKYNAGMSVTTPEQNIVVNVSNTQSLPAFSPSATSAPPPPPKAPSDDDLVARLRSLHALHTDGILTDEEFAAQKQRILQQSR